jgi:heme oxygenase
MSHKQILQQALIESTKKNHAVLEQMMFVNQIVDGSLSLQQYMQILTTNYLIHQVFEDRLFKALSPANAIALEINGRRKLQALINDMDELEMELPEQSTDSQYLQFEESDAAILGYMYVLENATLNGNILIKQLKENPNLNNLNLPFNYYQVYGNDLVLQWKKFCEVLNSQPEHTYNTSINAAKKMYYYIAFIQQQAAHYYPSEVNDDVEKVSL